MLTQATPITQSHTRSSWGGRRLIACLFYALLIGAVYLTTHVSGQGTLAPSVYQVVLDSSGNPVVGAKVCTYLAGTTTLTPTYTSSTLAVENSNPIITDASGRWTAFLSPGASYKWIVYANDGTAATCDGTVLKTQDNISAVPSTSNNIDMTGTAGEALTAGQAVYLSDGSGSKTAGQWYLADADFSYSSTDSIIGIAPSAITSGASGTIRLSGLVTGLSALVVGSNYYVSATAGGLTATPGALVRFVGRAMSASTLTMVISPSSPPQADYVCGRATLTTTVPVTTTDVSSATMLYYTPVGCNLISLYDNTTGLWNAREFSELSVAVSSTTNATNYDLFVYDSNGTPTIEVSSAWTGNTAIYASGIYATARPTQDGRWIKSTNGTAVDATRRYVGSYRTEAGTGYLTDTQRQRLVYNAYNKVSRSLRWLPTTVSWTQAPPSVVRQANNNPYNQLEILRGLDNDPVEARIYGTGTASAGTPAVAVAFGLDTTTSVSSDQVVIQARADYFGVAVAAWSSPVGFGWHRLAWLEMTDNSGGGTVTWYGRRTGAYVETGMVGTVRQ